LASAFTYHELEKVASTFDLDVGDLLLLEATNLNDAVLVGSKRTLYFSTETSKLISIEAICLNQLHLLDLKVQLMISLFLAKRIPGENSHNIFKNLSCFIFMKFFEKIS